MRNQHDLEERKRNRLAAANAFANYLAAVKGYGPPGSGGQMQIDKDVWDVLKLPREALPELLSVLDAELHAVAEVLKI